jgi:hypothetical protein
MTLLPVFLQALEAAGHDTAEKIKISCLCRESNSDYSAAKPID